MIVDVVMPKMGESIMEGTIIEWSAAIGDAVTRDETLLEISTDKVDSEIPSPATGKLVEILFEPQSVVEVGEVIARIGTEDEAISEPALEATQTGPKAIQVEPEAAEKKVPQAVAPKAVAGRFYSPLIRAIAVSEKITQTELDRLAGTGRDGRGSKADVKAYLAQRNQGRSPIKAPTAPSMAKVPSDQLVDEVVPMSRIRTLIAQHMRVSLETSAHVYGISECDITRAVDFRSTRGADFLGRAGIKLTYTPMIAYATILAIQDFPLINARIDGPNIVKKKNINLGIAVALPDDNLIVPVVKSAEKPPFLDLAKQITDLAPRARAGQLLPDEIADSTFTITNPGIYGNLLGLPIINQPNVGILAVGSIKKRPVVWESEGVDSIVIRSMMMLSLGHDHRLIDGAYGARFLERVVHHLQTTDWNSLI
jgi:2-oxoglutarate dehydrogenase E2 component (dihydrolipoamide succinyltransferase)